MQLRSRIIPCLATALLLATAPFVITPAQAEKFPEKPITLIVPFGPGGGFDQAARALVPSLQKTLGVPIAVKDEPGAGGRRGTIDLYRSKPDGYTIGLTYFVGFITDKHLFKKPIALNLDKFEIIYRTSRSSLFLYAKAKGPYQSLNDLKDAKAPVRISITAVGTSAWVAARLMSTLLHFKPNFILGYKSLTAAAIAVARGDADAGVGGVGHFSGVADDVKPLVYFDSERNPEYPKVPTSEELGYPEASLLGGIHVFSAPPGTPKDRVEILRAAFREAVKDPGFRRWAKQAFNRVDPGEPDQVRAQNKSLGKLFDKLPLDLPK